MRRVTFLAVFLVNAQSLCWAQETESVRSGKEEGMKRGKSERVFSFRRGKKGKAVNTPPSDPNPSVVTGVATGSVMNSTEVKQLVDYHNQVRAEVGVGEVSWSPELAAYAQEWADHLVKVGTFEHRPSSERRYGENLAAGSDPRYDGLKGARSWYAEKSLYQKNAPFSMKFMKAGHYTQMVWRGSTQIGAGKAVFASGKYKGWTIIVCNYNPRGNMLGQPAY